MSGRWRDAHASSETSLRQARLTLLVVPPASPAAPTGWGTNRKGHPMRRILTTLFVTATIVAVNVAPAFAGFGNVSG